MLKAVGFSSLVVKTRLSAESEAMPVAESAAPPVADELSHPRAEPAGGFEHGHGRAPPTPGSHKLENPDMPRSRTKMSLCAFVSPGTRFVAQLTNTASRLSAEIAPRMLSELAFPIVPPVETLTSSVVESARSRRKMSPNPLVSPGTAFVALL